MASGTQTNGESRASDVAVSAPPSHTERILLDIWSTVLSRHGLSVHDDFLDLGGDSLSAMRCANRVRVAFGVDLPLEVFFQESAHIAEIAAHVDRLSRELGASAATLQAERP